MMAFAYVKFLEGPKRGRKEKVVTSRIEPNVDKLNYNINKKYTVNCEGQKYQCIVIFAAESEEILEAKIHNMPKRIKVTPSHLLDTATSGSENDIPAAKKPKILGVEAVLKSTVGLEKLSSTKENNHLFSKSISQTVAGAGKKVSNKARNIKRFSNILNMNTNDLEKIVNTENKKVDGNCSADEQLVAGLSFEPVDESICPMDNFMEDSQSTVSLPSTLSARTTPPNTPTKVTKQSVSKHSSRKTSKSTKNEKASDSSKREPSITVDDDDGSTKKIKKLKTDMKEKDKEIQRLKKKIETLKVELKQATEKAVRTESLNIQLQKNIIDKFNEKQKVEEQVKGEANKKDMDFSKNFPPVGFRRAADETFAGNVATAIFGESVLLKSTVTGRISNRSRANGEIGRVEKLDPTKLQACKEFFKHWLEGTYKNTLTKEELEDEDLNGHLKDFDVYIGRKISYLKVKDTPKCSKKKRKSQPEQNEKIIEEKNDSEPANDSSKKKEDGVPDTADGILNENDDGNITDVTSISEVEDDPLDDRLHYLVDDPLNDSVDDPLEDPLEDPLDDPLDDPLHDPLQLP